jgi:chemotaxis protein MotA
LKTFPLSLVIALICIYLAVLHLGQDLKNYFDYVAFVIVLGGTTAVAVSTFPWEYKKDMWVCLRMLFSSEKTRYKQVLQICMRLIEKGPLEIDKIKINKKNLYGRTLIEGLELLTLSFDDSKLEFIIREKVFHASKRYRRVANAFRSLAKYPPAFGLAGTVLGLVNIMRGLDKGLDAKQTAVEMSVALVATFYGLLVANLIINPAGELVLKKSHEEEELAELCLQTILMIHQKTSLLEAQEILNALVPEECRISGVDEESLVEVA